MNSVKHQVNEWFISMMNLDLFIVSNVVNPLHNNACVRILYKYLHTVLQWHIFTNHNPFLQMAKDLWEFYSSQMGIFNSRHSDGHFLCWHCHEMGGQLGERRKGGRMLQMLQNRGDLNVTWRFCWPILIAQKLSCILVGSHTDMKVWPVSIRVFLKNPLMAFGDCGMALATTGGWIAVLSYCWG